MATNYNTKWLEAKALCNNIIKSIVIFFYENIITKFGCLSHLARDQGSHFINDTIEILTIEFMITHHRSTTYYWWRVLDKLNQLTRPLSRFSPKLVNVDFTNWDVMLLMMLWAYQMTYKEITWHTPYELVFGTNLVLPTEFIILLSKKNYEWKYRCNFASSHYEKLCPLKPHYLITKIQKTIYIQLLCNYLLGITTNMKVDTC